MSIKRNWESEYILWDLSVATGINAVLVTQFRFKLISSKETVN